MDPLTIFILVAFAIAMAYTPLAVYARTEQRPAARELLLTKRR